MPMKGQRSIGDNDCDCCENSQGTYVNETWAADVDHNPFAPPTSHGSPFHHRWSAWHLHLHFFQAPIVSKEESGTQL